MHILPSISTQLVWWVSWCQLKLEKSREVLSSWLAMGNLNCCGEGMLSVIFLSLFLQRAVNVYWIYFPLDFFIFNTESSLLRFKYLVILFYHSIHIFACSIDLVTENVFLNLEKWTIPNANNMCALKVNYRRRTPTLLSWDEEIKWEIVYGC